jgi:purine-binding chemotaxis protein CheW
MEHEFTTKQAERHILVFNLEKEEFGVDISCVREVVIPQKVHPLPKAPAFIEGVINLRGHIIALMDLRKRLNIESKKDSHKAQIIICKIKNFIVGIMVDSVNEVISLSEENIEATPKVVSMQEEGSHIGGIVRLQERVITLLDLERILTKKETARLSQIKR